MKKLFATISILSLIGMMVVGLAKAATEATVTATVTVQNISVSVTDGTVTYGTLGQNSTQNTLPAGVDDMQTATNNGNITEDFNIKAIADASTPDWTIGGTAGSDVYTHHFCNDTADDCTTPLTNYTALTTSYQALATGVSTSGTVDFQLQINTPNPSSVYTEQSVDVTVQAVAG